MNCECERRPLLPLTINLRDPLVLDRTRWYFRVLRSANQGFANVVHLRRVHDGAPRHVTAVSCLRKIVNKRDFTPGRKNDQRQQVRGTEETLLWLEYFIYV
jgi:hypothetical protein